MRCEGGEHYLWGENGQNECLVFGQNVVPIPQRVELKGEIIKDVFLGNENTKIIVAKEN